MVRNANRRAILMLGSCFNRDSSTLHSKIEATLPGRRNCLSKPLPRTQNLSWPTLTLRKFTGSAHDLGAQTAPHWPPPSPRQWQKAEIDLDPNDPLAHFVLGRHDDAIEFCRQACRVPGSEFSRQVQLAVALAEARRHVEAKSAVEKALEANPSLTVGFLKNLSSGIHRDTVDP